MTDQILFSMLARRRDVNRDIERCEREEDFVRFRPARDKRGKDGETQKPSFGDWFDIETTSEYASVNYPHHDPNGGSEQISAQREIIDVPETV